MRASRLLGATVVVGAATYAVRRGAHQAAIKRIVKARTAIMQGIEDRALGFAINHMSDKMTQAVIAHYDQKAESVGDKTPGNPGPVELVDTVDELPEK